MDWELMSVIVAIFLALTGINLLVLGMRLLFGSSDAYELNRSVTGKFRETVRGQLKKDESEGKLLTEHGVAFRVGSDSTDKCIVLPQSKLSTEAIFDTLR